MQDHITNLEFKIETWIQIRCFKIWENVNKKYIDLVGWRQEWFSAGSEEIPVLVKQMFE